MLTFPGKQDVTVNVKTLGRKWLHGQLEVRRASAVWRLLLFCQNLGGQLPANCHLHLSTPQWGEIINYILRIKTPQPTQGI